MANSRRYIQGARIGKPGARHIVRHIRATLILENGADLRYLQAILGHEKLDTTQIDTRTSRRKLLELHGATPPVERREELPESDADKLLSLTDQSSLNLQLASEDTRRIIHIQDVQSRLAYRRPCSDHTRFAIEFKIEMPADP